MLILDRSLNTENLIQIKKEIQMLSLDNPRQIAIAAMMAMIPAEVWEQNEKFLASLSQEIREHPMAKHPMIKVLNDGAFSKEAMHQIHLEYRHAIVQVFTDALLIAQHQSRQLEPRLAPGAKMYPRFLLTLNILDEFGFRPGYDRHKYYQGNPAYAHYPLFEQLLDEYGISREGRLEYKPSTIAQEVRTFLEQSFGSYTIVVALLAVAEEEVILFSPPLRRNTAALGINVDSGYYFVHGTSGDKSANACDDDHEDDLWHVLAQAALPEEHAQIRKACLKYCDLWDQFWTHQLQLLSDSRKTKMA